VLHFGVAGVGGDYQLRPSQSSQTTSAFETVTRATMVGFRSMNRGLDNVYRAQIGGVPIAALGCGTSATGGAVTGCSAPRDGSPGEIGVNVDQKLLGFETAVARGPLKVQGEWVRADYSGSNPIVAATGGANSVRGDVDTWYLQAMWNITGEKWSEMYRAGIFRGVTPSNNFKLGSGWGAWQVGFRWSQFDATDLVVGSRTNGDRLQSGGLCDDGTGRTCGNRNAKVDSYGIGVNWILNPMARLMFEWTRTDFGGETIPLDVDRGTGSVGAATRTNGITKEDIFSFRAQVNF
jgi:phosphate-selective porin OprO/OprP